MWGPQTASWRVLAPGIALTVLLLLLPTGFEGALIYQDAEKVRATVLEVDNGAIINNGIIQNGEQYCTLRIEEGSFAGQQTGGVNLLSGSLEQDKMFTPGDSALVVVSHAGGQITAVTMIDHYRIHWEIFLAVIFGLLLVLFAGAGRAAGAALLCHHRALDLEDHGPRHAQGRRPHLGGAFARRAAHGRHHRFCLRL